MHSVFLSPHFTLSELTFSQTATRYGIDNSAPPDVVKALEALCRAVLEPVRREFGAVRVTSGYRCLALNRRIGSKDSSQHVRGEAADIVIPNVRPLAVCRWLDAHKEIPWDQVISEFGDNGWTHVSHAANGEQRRKLLTIDRFGTREGILEARSAHP